MTEVLIDYIVSTQYEDLPEEVVLAGKRLLMNTFAAALCGSGADGVREIAQLMKYWGGEGRKHDISL